MSFDGALVDPGAAFAGVFAASSALVSGAVANAKEDTVLLLLGGVLDTDESQYSSGLTLSASGAYKDPDPLRVIYGSTGRELYIRLEVDPAGADSVFLIHADPAAIASNTYKIHYSGGTIEFTQGATLIHSLATSLGDVSDISIQWTTRPNPDTTGAGDAMLSEFTVYDHSAGDYLEIQAQERHTVSTSDIVWALSVGGFWDGASLTLPSGLVSEVRIGRAGDHSSVEFHEDWVAQRSAPPADFDPVAIIPGPLTQASDLGDVGQWAGAANMGWAAAHARSHRRRQWSPLVNEVYPFADPWEKTPSEGGGTRPGWTTLAPGSATYQMRLEKLRWVPVPHGATHAWVRVQVRSYVTSGAAVPIALRVYAMNRPPVFDSIPLPPPFEYSMIQSDLLTVDHTVTGVGEWLQWGGLDGALLKLPVYLDPSNVGMRGTVHLCLAYAVDPLLTSANDAAARITPRAFHCRPTTINGGDPQGGYAP